MPHDGGLLPARTSCFVCYSRNHKRHLEQLRQRLEEQGQRVAVDVADLYAGERWRQQVTDLIARADNVVWIVTPDSLESQACAFELSSARQLGKRVIPLVQEGCRLPSDLSEVHFISFSDRIGAAVTGALMAALATDKDWVRIHTSWTVHARDWREGHSSLESPLDRRTLRYFKASAHRYEGKEPGLTNSHWEFLASCRSSLFRRSLKRWAVVVASALATSVLIWMLWQQARGEEVLRKIESGEPDEAVAALASLEGSRSPADEVAAALAQGRFAEILDAFAGSLNRRDEVILAAIRAARQYLAEEAATRSDGLIGLGTALWNLDMIEASSERLAPQVEQLRARLLEPLGLPPEIPEDNWIWLPGGSFSLGTRGLKTTEPVHRVWLSPFLMMEREVTNEQFAHLRVARPRSGGPNLPVIDATWFEAVVFSAWVGGRLPTEAEWEFAALGPEKRSYPWGEAPQDCELAQMRWCGDVVEVCSKSGRTPEGICDLVGNAVEWVSNVYRDRFEIGDVVDPRGPVKPTGLRVRRGFTHYQDDSGSVNAAENRVGSSPLPQSFGGRYGFRVAKSARSSRSEPAVQGEPAETLSRAQPYWAVTVREAPVRKRRPNELSRGAEGPPISPRSAALVVEKKGPWSRLVFPRQGWVHERNLSPPTLFSELAKDLPRWAVTTRNAVLWKIPRQQEIRSLRSGSLILAHERRGKWLRTEYPERGWVYQSYVSFQLLDVSKAKRAAAQEHLRVD